MMVTMCSPCGYGGEDVNLEVCVVELDDKSQPQPPTNQGRRDRSPLGRGCRPGLPEPAPASRGVYS